MRRITYFPAGAATVPTIRLAEKLAEITPGSLSRVFPVSGGSEANETALKIARAYHKRRGEPGRYKIVSRRGLLSRDDGRRPLARRRPARPA